MITIDQFEIILDHLAEELPKAFFKDLNLGIVIEENCKMHPNSTAETPLYIMGEYQTSQSGRGIVIYYGSFEKCYGSCSEEPLTRHMRKVLRHEFRHHMESLSGMRDLEIIDKMELEKMTGIPAKD